MSGPAKGCLIGAVAGLALWIGIIWLVLRWLAR